MQERNESSDRVRVHFATFDEAGKLKGQEALPAEAFQIGGDWAYITPVRTSGIGNVDRYKDCTGLVLMGRTFATEPVASQWLKLKGKYLVGVGNLSRA